MWVPTQLFYPLPTSLFFLLSLSPTFSSLSTASPSLSSPLHQRPSSLSFSSSSSASPPDPTNSGIRPRPDQVIFVNPFTQSLVVVGIGPDLPRSAKGGRPPASRASIEAMPSVEADEGRECECRRRRCRASIGSTEGCNEQWLGVHGTCPVCRYEMPVKGREPCEKREGGVWVSFGFDFGFGGDDDSDDHNFSSS